LIPGSMPGASGSSESGCRCKPALIE
jgi:hypothetical protein